MAAMPKRRRMKAALLKRARAALGPDATALDYICQWIAGGRPIKDLAASLQCQLGESVSRSILSTLAHHLAPDASTRIRSARETSTSEVAQLTNNAPEVIEADCGKAERHKVAADAPQTAPEFDTS
jgi:hypothetical protein